MTTPSFSFSLTPDPAPPITSTATATPQALPQRPATKRGLIRPFRLDGKGGFARVSGDALLEEKLGNLLALGGLPWAPGRTSHLDELRHMAGTAAFQPFARAFIAEAIRTYLPVLALEGITVEGRGPTATIFVEAVKVRDPNTTLTAQLRR